MVVLYLCESWFYLFYENYLLTVHDKSNAFNADVIYRQTSPMPAWWVKEKARKM